MKDDPTVRLAATTAMTRDLGDAAARYPMHKDYPSVRLAHCDGAQGDGALKGENDVPQVTEQQAPALLVSYVYIEPFMKNKHLYRYRDWVLDSGAFSAHNSGYKIDLNQYIDFCAKMLAEDPTLTEVFALDVVGDHEASIKNTEEMWRQGVPAIPCFHADEPEEALYHIAKEYPKIALGGVALERIDRKLKWATQCFARVWPKKIHGFAFCSAQAILGLPFHSVDATSWEIGPCAFGSWEKYGQMSVRGSNQDLRSQVIHYLDLEAKARVRWKKEMALLAAQEDRALQMRSNLCSRLAVDGIGPGDKMLCSPTVRLAVDGIGPGDKMLCSPTVRLAVEPGSGRGLGDKGLGHAADPSVRLAVADPSKDGREGQRMAKATQGTKAKAKPAEKVASTGMDPKWVDYWKNR